MYMSTKQFFWLSCCFRQWGAESHCRLMHGYAISIKLRFMAHDLDANNWVVDFGGLKTLKASYEHMFDHTTLVAENDPMLDTFRAMNYNAVIDLRIVKATGCEAFAKIAYDLAKVFIDTNGYGGRVILVDAEVSEHGANSAIYSEA